MPSKRSRALSLSADWDSVFGLEVKKDNVQKHAGFKFEERPLYTHITKSKYLGQWNALGMAGFGTYTFPHSK